MTLARQLLSATALLSLTGAATACSVSHPAARFPATVPSSAPPPEATSTTRPEPPPTPGPTASTAPSGPPYAVTQTTLNLVDPSRPTVSKGRVISNSRALTTLVWMPTATRRWPLVVFAHGFQVGPAPYMTLLESWAAHGYVVAAPEFPLTDSAIAGSNLDEYDINNQPADVRFVTDYLVSGRSPLAGRVDPARVAVAGHSDGAETAIAAGTEPAPAGEPAYRAIAVFGAQPVAGAAGRNPPMLIGQGDQDQINPPSYGYDTFQEAVTPKYLVVYRGGGHLSPLEAGSTWLPGIEAVSEAFLDAYVTGDLGGGAVRSTVATYPYLSVQAG